MNILEKCVSQQIELIVIGASAGGIDAIKNILPGLTTPSELKIAIVLHYPANETSLLQEIFQDSCPFKVKEVIPGEDLVKETLYVAPPDYHLNIESNGTLALSNEGPKNFSRPSIDILFETAAYAYGKKVVAIILSGANEDGAEGLQKIKRQGGVIIIQDPKEALFPQMPKAAINAVEADLVSTTGQMRTLLTQINERLQ